MMLLNFRHCFTFYICSDLLELISTVKNYLHVAKRYSFQFIGMAQKR